MIHRQKRPPMKLATVVLVVLGLLLCSPSPGVAGVTTTDSTIDEDANQVVVKKSDFGFQAEQPGLLESGGESEIGTVFENLTGAAPKQPKPEVSIFRGGSHPTVVPAVAKSDAATSGAQPTFAWFPDLWILVRFAGICCFSYQVGNLWQRLGLPRISGYLLSGIFLGPYIFAILGKAEARDLRTLDQMALGNICVAAGAEMHFQSVARLLHRILGYIAGAWICVFLCISTLLLVISPVVPFLAEQPAEIRIAAAVLAGTVMLARSPASAIAVIKETRSAGAFTSLVLGICITSDVLLITLFSVNLDLIKSWVGGVPLNLGQTLQPMLRVFWSVVVGCGLGRLMASSLRLRLPGELAEGDLVGGSTKLARMLATVPLPVLPFLYARATQGDELFIFIEPLLCCIAAGLWICNFSRVRERFHEYTEHVLPWTNLSFFSSAGLGVALDALFNPQFIAAAVCIYVTRLAALAVGTRLGVHVSRHLQALSVQFGMAPVPVVEATPVHILKDKDATPAAGVAIPSSSVEFQEERHAQVLWMALITQAGVCMGLARDVGAAFPTWGVPFASLIICVVLMNLLTGPLLFKRSLRLVGEAGRADRPTLELAGGPGDAHSAGSPAAIASL